jgi:hypothetical protein
MMIDSREAQVFIGRLAQILKELFMRRLRRDGARPDLLQ